MTSLQTERFSKGLNAPFKTGDAWRSFLSLEKSLSEFVEYVPLDRRNQNVFSPKLGDILISASTQVEATFKAVIFSDYLDSDENIQRTELEKVRRTIEERRGNLHMYRELLEPCFRFSKRKVTIRQYPKVYRLVRPFQGFRREKAPSWWESYTALKHSFYGNIKEATLRRVFDAVSALLVIQLMHLSHRATLIEMGVIRSGFRGLEEKVLPASELKRLLCTSPMVAASDVGVKEVWVETQFFDMSLLSS